MRRVGVPPLEDGRGIMDTIKIVYGRDVCAFYNAGAYGAQLRARRETLGGGHIDGQRDRRAFRRLPAYSSG